MFPWSTWIFDKQDDSHSHSGEIPITTAEIDQEESDKLDQDSSKAKTLKTRLSYYQVLIDNRDIPYIRSQPESVTFLSGPKSNRSVYSIHGLDYVSHSDILPYRSTERVPIVHDLFDKFLVQSPVETDGRENSMESELNFVKNSQRPALNSLK